MIKQKYYFILAAFFTLIMTAFSDDCLQLQIIGDFEKGDDGWLFHLGNEFKGAEGNFAPGKTCFKTGKCSGWFEGYFAKGGKYVGIKKQFKILLNIQKIEFWLKTSDLSYITFRITGSDNQTLQVIKRLKQTKDWQKVTIDNFTYNAIHWGGKNDKKLYQPVKEVMIIMERRWLKEKAQGKLNSGQIWLDMITLFSKRP